MRVHPRERCKLQSVERSHALFIEKRKKKADWEALDKIVIRREDVLSV